jgi:hypothetical protein
MNRLLKIWLPILLILGLVLAAGCAAKESPPIPLPSPTPAPLAPSAEMKGTVNYADLSSAGTSGGASTDRRIVKTGSLTLEVDSTVQTIDKVAAIADELGGYVVSSNKHADGETIAGSISIRVPVERFDEALGKIRKLAIEVPYENTAGTDITEEYTDLEAQLRNLEATEAQYLELLQKAQTVEDILKVQRELSNVRGQIEQIKGRIQYLERTSDTALIEVNLQETKAVGESGWSAMKTLKSAVDGFITFGKVLASLVIWLVIFCPVWGIILFLVIFFRRRRKAKAKTS